MLNVLEASSSISQTPYGSLLSSVLSCVSLEQFILTCHSHAFAFIALRVPQLEHVLEPLLSLLSSEQTNDAISEELVEIIGFDHMDLSTELLERRADARDQISAYLPSGIQVAESAPFPQVLHNGSGKGKQREGIHCII